MDERAEPRRRLDALRLARLLALLALVVALIDLIVGRGVRFLAFERQRAGLPPIEEFWAVAVPYVTVFAGLVASAAAGALGYVLASSPAPPLVRALGAGVATAVVTLCLAATIFPPGVRGILTIHATAAVGGLVLGAAVVLSRVPGDLKLLAACTFAVPFVAVFHVAFDDGGVVATVFRWTYHVAAAAAAAIAAYVAVRRHRSGHAGALVGALGGTLVLGSVLAAAFVDRPWRAVEFVLLSHGLLLDFRGGLVLFLAVAFATVFAALAFMLAAVRAGDAARGRSLVGCGLALVLLGGPVPVSPVQSAMLAAGILAIVAGLPERARVPDPLASAGARDIARPCFPAAPG